MCFVLLAISTIPSPVLAQSEGDQPAADKTLSPYFFVQGDPNVDHLPLKDTKVEISISGVIADV
jgi:Ca-activated chloride channel family protein